MQTTHFIKTLPSEENKLLLVDLKLTTN